MFYILSVANQEKLLPQRKITKKGYSPKERKERAGSGTELLAGLGEGTGVLTPPDNPTWRLGGWWEPAAPTSPAELCILFSLFQKEGCFKYPWSCSHTAGFVALLTHELSGADVHTVAVSMQASLERSAGSPSRVDSSDPCRAADHLETSRSISSRKQGDSVKCCFFCHTES